MVLQVDQLRELRLNNAIFYLFAGMTIVDFLSTIAYLVWEWRVLPELFSFTTMVALWLLPLLLPLRIHSIQALRGIRVSVRNIPAELAGALLIPYLLWAFFIAFFLVAPATTQRGLLIGAFIILLYASPLLLSLHLYLMRTRIRRSKELLPYLERALRMHLLLSIPLLLYMICWGIGWYVLLSTT